MRVLSLCTSAGLWDKAYLEAGHEVIPGGIPGAVTTTGKGFTRAEAKADALANARRSWPAACRVVSLKAVTE